MNGGFKKRVLLLTGSNLILQSMGFAYRMALAAYAGTAALGLNSLVMQIYSIVVSVCISGVSVAVTATAAGLGARGGTPPEFHSLFKKAAVIYVLLWLSAALPIFLLRRPIAVNALGEPASAPTLALMLVCIFMTGLENVLKALHIGIGRVGVCAASELCEQAVRFALVILLLIKIPDRSMAGTVHLIILGMTASELVSVGFLSSSFIKRFGLPSKNTKGSGGGASYADLFGIALPASGSAMASTAFASAAALLLPGRLALFGMGREQALSLIGVMNSVAVPITALPMAAVSALASVLMPEVASRMENGGGAGGLARSALAKTTVFAVASTALIVPVAPFAAEKLFGVSAEPALFTALGIRSAVIYVQVVAVSALNGAKEQKAALAFAICGEAYQLVLMLLLTPVWGVYGYIAASAAGELLRLALCLIKVKSLDDRHHSF